MALRRSRVKRETIKAHRQIRRVFARKLPGRADWDRSYRLPVEKICGGLDWVSLIGPNKELDLRIAAPRTRELRWADKLVSTYVTRGTRRAWKSSLIETRRSRITPRINRRTAWQQRVNQGRTTIILKGTKIGIHVRQIAEGECNSSIYTLE